LSTPAMSSPVFLVLFQCPLPLFQSIRWSVCLFVCPLAYLKPYAQLSPNFLYMLPVTVARSFSDGSAIRYVLPVLWMTSCFHLTARMGQNQRRRVCFVQFARWRNRGRHGKVYRLRLHVLTVAFYASSGCGEGLTLLCV